MIKKTKSIILLFLIISLQIRCVYADTGVDSNAFITKDEYDNVMSDFENRLAQFESGINSKIDSQVTSYLDRNGIWKKASQKVLTSVVSFPALNRLDAGDGTIAFERHTNLCNMFTSDKTGLAFCRAFYYSTRGNTADSWWGWALNSKANKQVTNDYLLATIDFYEGTEVDESKIKSSWLIGNVSDTANANTNVWTNQISLMIALPAEKVYNNIMFFVDKGKTYSYRFYGRGQVNRSTHKETRNHGGQFGVETIDVY